MNMLKIHYREEMDEQACSECKTPDCSSVLYIHGSCHPDSPTRAKYIKRFGLFVVECSVCNALIFACEVAYRPVPVMGAAQ